MKFRHKKRRHYGYVHPAEISGRGDQDEQGYEAPGLMHVCAGGRQGLGDQCHESFLYIRTSECPSTM